MTTQTCSTELLQKELEILRNENKYLKEQIEWFKRQIFGKRSEKIVHVPNERQLIIPGCEPIEEPKIEKRLVSAHARKKPCRNGKDKISFPESLPIERQVIDLPEKEKICPETGVQLVKIGEEVTQKLAHKPGSYYIKEIIRPKYALPQNSEVGIRIAELPESLLNRCQADESLLADILTKKFSDHLPLYRQSEILSREGINLSRQIMCQWVVRCGKALKPLYDEMARQILQSGNIFCDETTVDMLDPGKGKTHQSYMWVLAGGQEADPGYRVYNFRTNRQHSNAIELLQGYQGVLHSDKYGAYEKLANRKQIQWCPCWAHIRRKFFEAESGDPPFREMVLDRIGELFKLEKVAWTQSEEERLRIRQKEEIPIIDELIKAVKDKLIHGKVLPKSKFREALGYFCGLIPYLKNYTKYSFARLDNNVGERAMRPIAVGRKNWLFVGNEEGGEAAAVIFSLLQSCMAIEVNPREYLEDIMRRVMSHPANKLKELLPDEWIKNHQQNIG